MHIRRFVQFMFDNQLKLIAFEATVDSCGRSCVSYLSYIRLCMPTTAQINVGICLRISKKFYFLNLTYSEHLVQSIL